MKPVFDPAFFNMSRTSVRSGREDPCPALPVCAMVGNARNGCDTGGAPNMSPDVCLAGLILLTARGQGLYTEDMESELQERRRIGFVYSPEE